MKTFRTCKKTILVLVILLWAILSIIDYVPELPSSQPITQVDYGSYIRAYMVENLFAIVFCIMSLVIGILMIIYGLSVKRNISKLKKEGAVAVNLGEFVLISGIWVITDSRALTIFTTDCGGMLNRNAIAFLSYISIMLLPIIYIFPLFRRYYRSKSCGLWMGCLY